MKKKFGLLCSSVLALCTITGCNLFNKDKEPEKELTFSEYLNAQETLTAAQLDAKIGEIDFDRDEYLTALDIPNSKIVLSYGDSISANAYMWTEVESNDQILYAAAPLGENAQQVVYKVNLTEIDSVLTNPSSLYLSPDNSLVSGDDIVDDELNNVHDVMQEVMADAFADTNDSGAVEFSEVIDNIFGAYGLDTTIYNVDTILSKIKFDIDDFTDKGNGVYKLKASALVDLVEEIFGQDYPNKDDMIDAIEEVLEIEVKYDENEIRQIKATVSVVEEDYDYSVSDSLTLRLDFDYDKSELTKTTIDLVYSSQAQEVRSLAAVTPDFEDFPMDSFMPYNSYMHLQISFGENEFAYRVSNGETAHKLMAETIMSIKEVDGRTTLKIVGKAVNDSNLMKEIVNMEVGFVANWLADATIVAKIPQYDEDTDSVIEEEIRVSIENTVNVTIPDSVKNVEAIDATQFILQTIEESLK